ncbi:MAG TPA: T9SS type A sorting domain-containing protein [Bacteroidetes bacterium]|nr:T9SS type A sorting domain-containing protein [Bacteroidota bacterium]
MYFPPLLGNEWETLSPDSLNWCENKIEDFYTFLDNKNTKAFILLKDGKIVLEKYFDGFTQDSTWYWASAGKSMTAILTGIAQEEGLLDIDDPTSDYLGTGWTSAPADKEALISIRHQLSMTSGLDDAFSFACTSPGCLKYKADAGTRWAYHNGPYTNITKVIEAATGKTYNQYFFNKISLKTGITGLWVQLGFNEILFSKARSMARYGLLIQNNGTWKNTPVLSDAQYFNDMVNPSQNINKSYGYLWWLNGGESYMLPRSQTVFPGMISPDAPEDMFAAMGKDAQYLNIAPSKGIVFVRMGESPDTSLVPISFNNEIWHHINGLECAPNSTGEKIKNELHIYPNPVGDYLKIDIPENIGKYSLQVFDVFGKEIFRAENDLEIDVSGFLDGVYFLKLRSGKREWSNVFIKE